MSKTRLLVVDDQPLFHHILLEWLRRESDVEFVGSAQNGREALTQIHLLQPDLIILDIEMPGINGWETLQAIQLSYPDLAVIVFTALPQDAEELAAKARALGARDLVLKPTNIDGKKAAPRDFCEDLLAKIREHSGTS